MLLLSFCFVLNGPTQSCFRKSQTNKQKLLDPHAVPTARLPPAATSVPCSARATAELMMLSCASSLSSVPFVLLRWLKHHLKARQCSHFYPKQEANPCFCFSLCHLEVSEQLGQLCNQLWKEKWNSEQMPALPAENRAVCSPPSAPAGNAPGQTTLCLFPSRCCIDTFCISFALRGFRSAGSLPSVEPSTWFQHPLPQKLDGRIQCPHLAQTVLRLCSWRSSCHPPGVTWQHLLSCCSDLTCLPAGDPELPHPGTSLPSKPTLPSSSPGWDRLAPGIKSKTFPMDQNEGLRESTCSSLWAPQVHTCM